jgi:hypothetical protein
MSFAAVHPERTIGFVRYHAHLRGQHIDLTKIKRIPALLIAGERDSVAGIDDTETLWQAGRTLAAPWTFLVQPGEVHISEAGFETANALMLPWMVAVIRQRVSNTGLRPVLGRSWAADNATGVVEATDSFRGNDVGRSWLPDDTSAAAWKTLAASPPSGLPILPAQKAAVKRSQITVSSDVLSAYVGVYQLPRANLVVTVDEQRVRLAAPNPIGQHVNLVIRREGNNLYWDLPGPRSILLFAESERTFFTKAFEAQLTFSRNAKGVISNIELRHEDVLHQVSVLEAVRVPERTRASVLPAVLSAYVGQYELIPGVNLSITLDNGQLMAELGESGFKAPIFPESPARFFGELLDANIEFVRDDEGNITHLFLRQGGSETKAPRVTPRN